MRSVYRFGIAAGRHALPAFWLAACLATIVFVSSPATAQEALEAAFRRSPATDPQQRAALYQTLNEQAQILEAQSTVVKTVAKLLRKAHIMILDPGIP